jgi:hypothetical protein
MIWVFDEEVPCVYMCHNVSRLRWLSCPWERIALTKNSRNPDQKGQNEVEAQVLAARLYVCYRGWRKYCENREDGICEAAHFAVLDEG